MKKKIIFCLGVSVMFTLNMCLPYFAYAEDVPASFYVIDSTHEVAVGDEINVVISAKDIDELYGYEVNIEFDSNMLDYIKSQSLVSNIGMGIDRPEVGKITYAYTQIGDETPGYSGDIYLCKITFKAKSIGSSKIKLNNVEYLDSSYGEHMYSDINKTSSVSIIEHTNIDNNNVNGNSRSRNHHSDDDSNSLKASDNGTNTQIGISTASVKGWNKSIDGTWYFNDINGSKITNQWLSDAGKWYFLKEDGKMATGWLSSNEKWYYLGNDGAMKTGWIYYNSNWYFLNSLGDMLVGWINYNERWYYLGSSGDMKVGWINDNGTWYYLGESGEMVTSSTING
jgi:glucan-binding YG repeat protein